MFPSVPLWEAEVANVMILGTVIPDPGDSRLNLDDKG
jgi:hypothetical protein